VVNDPDRRLWKVPATLAITIGAFLLVAVTIILFVVL
jgi:hypothetical protein